MIATLAGFVLALVTAYLLLYVAHLIIESDDGPPVPVYVAPARHEHPCWAEYDPAKLMAAAAAVAAEFAAVRELEQFAAVSAVHRQLAAPARQGLGIDVITSWWTAPVLVGRPPLARPTTGATLTGVAA